MEGSGEVANLTYLLVMQGVQFLAMLGVAYWQYRLDRKVNTLNAELGHSTFTANEKWKRQRDLEDKLMVLLTEVDATTAQARNEWLAKVEGTTVGEAINNFAKKVLECKKFLNLSWKRS